MAPLETGMLMKPKGLAGCHQTLSSCGWGLHGDNLDRVELFHLIVTTVEFHVNSNIPETI